MDKIIAKKPFGAMCLSGFPLMYWVADYTYFEKPDSRAVWLKLCQTFPDAAQMAPHAPA
jgi:hypothetical protein